MALRLMRLRMDGDLSALGGKHWEHFRFGSDGKFYMPGWRYGWEPGELRGLFFRVQAAQHWEREAKRLEREVRQLKAEAPARCHPSGASLFYLRILISSPTAASPMAIMVSQSRVC